MSTSSYVTGTSTTELTQLGGIGAILFVLGPIASGIGWWQYSATVIANATARHTWEVKEPSAWLLLAGVGGIASLVGFVLFLSGRRLRHDISVRSADRR